MGYLQVFKALFVKIDYLVHGVNLKVFQKLLKLFRRHLRLTNSFIGLDFGPLNHFELRVCL